MTSLENFGKFKRNPISKSYVTPDPRTSPSVDTQRPEESDPENRPQSIDRLRETPQLIPLQVGQNRVNYNVLHQGNSQPTVLQIVDKARSDGALRDNVAESTDFSKNKAQLNIFSPSGLRYSKSNEAAVPIDINLVTSNILTTVNNLSNAGTNYHE